MSELAELNKTVDNLRDIERQMREHITLVERHMLVVQVMLGRTVKMRQQIETMHKAEVAKCDAS